MTDELPQSIPLSLQPVESVELTPLEMSAITDHINRKAITPNDACPVCGSPDNIVLKDVFRLDLLLKAPILGGEYQPIVTTVCRNCGYVRMFNRLIVQRSIELDIGEPKSTSSVETDGS